MKRLIFDEDHDLFRDATRRFMQAEIERGMKLMGCRTVSQLNRDNLRYR